LKTEESSNLSPLVAKNNSAEILAEFRRKQWKFFTVQASLFIGARGVVSRNYLDMTAVRNPKDACPLWHSEGDIFTRIQKFSWNPIVGVNLLPRGASVGELGKNLTPSKRRVCQNSWDKFENHPRDESTYFVKVKHSWRDPDKFQVFFSVGAESSPNTN
jgi:hypothetical protein